VHVSANERYKIDYELRPRVRIKVPSEDTTILGKFDAYCEEYGVKYGSSTSQNSEAEIIEIRNPESIRRFLEPVLPWLVARFEEADLMADEIAPAVEAGRHQEKEGFLELLERSAPLRSSPKSGAGHTVEEFEERWGIEA
jgi:hypothetical protein